MQKYKCSVCGYVYDEAAGVPEKGVAPGTKWADIPDSFVCPICNAPKSVFQLLADAAPPPVRASAPVGEIRALSAGEISAICANLAKGCEKQRLLAEMDAFNQIAAYFRAKTAAEPGVALADAAKMLEGDVQERFPAANVAAVANADRGAQRSLVWSEKVSAMAKALLERFAKEGDAMLENTGIFVCDICGFMYLGDAPPDICPVCKVPNFKITRIERRESYASL